MRDFQVLFDHASPDLASPNHALAPYGNLTFPSPPANRPWIYANFVQTIDGIVSLLGDAASGADISGSPEDRWLMDLLRAHADAVITGIGTLRLEQSLERPRPRGPVFRIVDPELLQLRSSLGRGRQRNILVSAHADFQLSDYAVFDGDSVDATVLTSTQGAQRLEAQCPPHSPVDIVAGSQLSGNAAPAAASPHYASPHNDSLDLHQAVAALTARYGLRYLLCEGGPQLYSSMLAASLIDELFLTVSPIQAGRSSPYGIRPNLLPQIGFSREEAVHWNWLSCRKVDDYQFHRFRRKPAATC